MTENSTQQATSDDISTEGRPVDLLPYLMNRLTAEINKSWLQVLRPYGLTIPRWQVLSVLSAYDGCRLGVLAQMCGAEQAVTSRVVEQMVQAGMVKRQQAKRDSRTVYIRITEQGSALYRELLPVAKDQIDHLIEYMGKHEAENTTTNLASLLAKMLT